MPNSRKETQTLSNDLFFMRGIGILLVVLVHVLGVDALHGVRQLFPPERTDLRVFVELIHSFNMAVMIMGSGVAVAAFGRADLSASDFMRKKASKLLIPMLVWAPALFAVQELKHSRPHGAQEWLELLRQLPAAWFPPYSIFWFMHALIGCTLLAWLFRKHAAPKLGRWSEWIYFGVGVALYLAVSTWRAGTLGGAVGEYFESILYWNRFFALGLLVHPWLGSVRQWLTRAPVALQALLPLSFFGLIALFYAVIPEEQYEVTRTINGPLGFCMLFSLAVFLHTQVSAWGSAWKEAWNRVAYVGSISMILYLFHLYFVSGTRVALEKWHAGTPPTLHLLIGTFAGCVGPWLIFQILKGYPLFTWSIGQATSAPRKQAKETQSVEGLGPIPSPKM